MEIFMNTYEIRNVLMLNMWQKSQVLEFNDTSLWKMVWTRTATTSSLQAKTRTTQLS